MSEIKTEYETQDNSHTAYPIYITVQELKFACVLDESYGRNMDGEVRYEYSFQDWEDAPFKSKSEAVKVLEEMLHGEKQSTINKAIEDVDEFSCLYIWTDVEVFLTKKGADEYIKANKHNLGETRKYVKHFSRRNFEMRNILWSLGFKTNG